jgi:hypothetical protein
MANQKLFNNNAVATLAVAITAVSTTLVLQTGQGALFPSPTTGQDFLVTLQNGSNTETILCSANGGDTLTVSGGVAGRAQEGTTAQAFAASTTVVEQRLTAGLLNGIITFLQGSLAALAGNVSQVFNVGVATASTHAVPLSQVESLIAGASIIAPPAAIPVTVTGSPLIYTATEAGMLSVSNANGSNITNTQLQRGTSTYPLGIGGSSLIPMGAGDIAKINFSGSPAPYVTFFPS